jgi:tetratricopeptide (TPR) repeat protein
MDFASGDQRGIKLAQQFLAVFRQTGNRRGEATSLSLLALFLEFQQKQTDLAIIHLKQAVNIYEAIRGDIKGLDKETQRSFVGKEEVVFTYGLLSDLLLKQGRITEALQVLDLLKVQELEDYFKTFKRTSATEKGVPLLAPEQAMVSRLSGNLTSDQYAQLNQQLSASIKQLSPTALNPIPDTLRQLPQDSALLYPVVLGGRLELVLFIPNQPPINRTIKAQIAMICKGENLSPDRKRSFEALRSSLPARVQGRLTHPFYWSPFIVIVNQF